MVERAQGWLGVLTSGLAGLFRWTGTWYLLVGVVLGVSVQPDIARVHRLDHLKYFESALDLAQTRGEPLTREALSWGLRYYKQCLVQSPRESLFYGNLAFCYYYLGDLAAAEKALTRAVQLAPSLYFYYMDLGLLALRAKDFQRAVLLFEQAHQRLPDVIESYKVLGKEGASRQEPYRMILAQSYQRAKQDQSAILVKRTESYFFLGDYPRMLNSALAGLSSNPEEPRLNYLAGLAYYSLGEYPVAIPFFDRAIGFDPQDIEAFYYRSLCFQKLGQPARQAADLRQVARLHRQGLRPKEVWQESRPHFYAQLLALVQQRNYFNQAEKSP